VLEEAKVHKNFFSLVLILLAFFQLHAQEKNDGDISFETDSMGLISVIFPMPLRLVFLQSFS
ncbi:MAG: hypothetical protein II077_17580, partial [Treponema sp.]|nr:hypothetical protein [Treponema sp.]